MVPQAEAIIIRAHWDLNLREVPEGSNNGTRLRSVLRRTQFEPGQPWCMYWVCAVMLDVFKDKEHVPLAIAMTGSCQVAAENAATLGRLGKFPATGCVFLLKNTSGHFHHAGIVTKVLELTEEFETVEGNTNAQGGTEGIGVFAHTRKFGDQYRFITW